MITARELLELLWEYATLHAAYLQNRSYTKHLQNETPYQGWHDTKPDVSHLREFGAPVWVLLQGQKEQRKMLPKSKRQVYIGYDNGAKAVKYYNAATQNVLTSHNYHYLTPSDPTPSEEIEVALDQPHGGELGENVPPPPTGITGMDEPTHNLEAKKRKQTNNDIDGDINIDEPRRMRGIHTDYRHLNDPFSDEKDEENSLLSMEEVYAIIARDELTSLKEAQNSPKWPEWEQAMQRELDLLKEMGTWELVQKPPDAVPIKNKWVFLKK